MVRQRSQSAWVRAFFGAADWARAGSGSATRSSAEADVRESRIAGLSKVVSVGALVYATNQAGVGLLEPSG